MAGLNLAIIVGNMGRDPETRYTSDNRKIALLSVATSRKYKTGSGEWKEATEWHRVVVFQESSVEYIERFGRKGATVLVTGEIRTRKWEDQSDQTHYTTEIVVQGFLSQLQVIAGGNRVDESEPEPSTARPRTPSRSTKPPTSLADDLDDEIPFAVLPALISAGAALLGIA